MPAAYFHEKIATTAWQRLRDQDPTLALHEAALLAGAQGPDPFFFYRVLHGAQNEPMRLWGERMHMTYTGDFLCALCTLASHGDLLIRSYALGFLTHYAGDSVIHPFVFAGSFDRMGLYRSDVHGLLEAWMETWLYREQGGKRIPRQMAGFAALGDGERVRIAQSLLRAMEQTYGESPTQEETLTAFSDCVHIPRLLYSPLGIKRRFFTFITRLAGRPLLVPAHTPAGRLPEEDFLRLSGMGWCSPWEPDRIRRESLPELWECAITRAAALMEITLAIWQGKGPVKNLMEALGDLGYDSGIPWRDSFHLSDGISLAEARKGAGSTQ